MKNDILNSDIIKNKINETVNSALKELENISPPDIANKLSKLNIKGNPQNKYPLKNHQIYHSNKQPISLFVLSKLNDLTIKDKPITKIFKFKIYLSINDKQIYVSYLDKDKTSFFCDSVDIHINENLIEFTKNFNNFQYSGSTRHNLISRLFELKLAIYLFIHFIFGYSD